MVESDGIEDAVAGAIRVALTVAAYRIEQAARDRQQRATDAARGSATEYQGYVDQHRAQRDAARAELMFTADQPGWWDTATPEQVGRAWETAQTWRGSDTDIDRQARQIEGQVKRRWGIDPTTVGQVPAGGWDRVVADAQRSADQRFAEQAHRADQQRDYQRLYPPGEQAAFDVQAAEYREFMQDSFGPDWATRQDLPPEAVQLRETWDRLGQFDGAVRGVEDVLAIPGSTDRDGAAAQDRLRKAQDRADAASVAPLLARPGEHPRVPSIEELIGSRPDAQRAAAAARGVTDPRAVEAVAVASAHQARPAQAAVATLAKPAAGRARTPRAPGRGAARDTGRSEGR